MKFKMLRVYSLACLAIATCGCSSQIGGTEKTPSSPNTDAPGRTEINQQIAELQATNTQVNNLIKSDFADCAGASASSDALFLKICQIAQAATVESKVQMKAELASFAINLNAKIQGVNEQLQRQGYFNTEVLASIAQLHANVSSLDNRMNNVESAIAGLQSFVAGAMNPNPPADGMIEIEIGSENLGAGPLFESVLMTNDRTRLNAVVESYYPDVPLIPNALTATTGNKDVVVYSYNFDMLPGDVIELKGAEEGKGLSAGSLAGQFTVKAVVDSDHFVIEAGLYAGLSGSFGGSSMSYRRLKERAPMTIWQLADGQDTAVRTTSWAKTPYNFAVINVGGVFKVCYSKQLATATIGDMASLNPTIACK